MSIFDHIKQIRTDFEPVKVESDKLVRTNIDLPPDIIKRWKIIAAVEGKSSKALKEEILTNLAVNYIPKL